MLSIDKARRQLSNQPQIIIQVMACFFVLLRVDGQYSNGVSDVVDTQQTLGLLDGAAIDSQIALIGYIILIIYNN